MTLPCLTYNDFIALLEENGYKVINSDYWNNYNRIIVKKDDYTFPLQYQTKYFYPIVVKTCTMLGITPPEDHQRCYEQEMALNKKGGGPESGEKGEKKA